MSDSSAAMSLLGKIARKPSRIGSPLSLIVAAPKTPGLRMSTSSAVTSSVNMPATDPRGMSLAGSWVSSAARGSSSMPRKNQIAKGMARKIPRKPYGRKVLPPASGAISKRLSTLNLPEKTAETKKIASTPSEMIAITKAKRNDAAAPAAFRATKIT
jgi:hypothetical protein